MQNNKLVLRTVTRASGLPAKSFIYIVTIDYYLKMGLSFLSSTNFFDVLVSSFIQWRFRYKDREKTATDFINFMATYDEGRINFLLKSKFFRRTDAIKILSDLSDFSEKYIALSKKDSEDLTVKDVKYIFSAKLKLGKTLEGVLRSIPHISKKISHIQDVLMQHYSSFIIQGLMKGRKGVHAPNEMKSDAYAVMMNMVNDYDPSRSKVPFNSYLVFFIKSTKNSMIKEQLWGLEEGAVVSIEDVEKGVCDKGNGSDGTVGRVEEFLDEDTDYKVLVEKLCEYLPFPLYKVMALNFGIIDPLNPTEEISILLD